MVGTEASRQAEWALVCGGGLSRSAVCVVCVRECGVVRLVHLVERSLRFDKSLVLIKLAYLP